MKLVWRLAKQRSANVKARRSPRRSLNVVGWLSVVSGRLLRPSAEAASAVLAVLQNGQPAVDVLMDNAEAALAVMQNGQPAVDDLMDNE